LSAYRFPELALRGNRKSLIERDYSRKEVINMNDFLPKGYETPEVPSNYMEFEEGQNYFRALSSAIVGYQWWIENGEGRKPVRVRTLEEVPEEFRNALDNRQNARHFWLSRCTTTRLKPYRF
jgi:hypothetical protein